MKYFNILLLLVTISFIGCKTDFNKVPLIKTELFFKNPEKSAFQISPDGKYISYLAPVNGKLNIFIKKIFESDGTRITNSTVRDIQNYFWVNNKQLVYSLDLIGNDNNQLFTVDIINKQTKHLSGNSNSNIYVINKISDNDGNILIASNKKNNRVYDVYLLNINNGNEKLVLQNNGKITWFLSNEKNVINVVSSTDGVNTGYYYRADENLPFKMFIATDYEDDFRPIAFLEEKNEIYALSNINRDKIAFVKYNIISKNEVAKIYEHNFVDIKDILFATYTKKIIGIEIVNQKSETIYLDKHIQSVAKKISVLKSGDKFDIVSLDKSEEKFIIKAFSDRNIGEYYLYINSKNELIELAASNNGIEPKNLAEMKPISFIAGDGKRITGYLSLPPKSKAVNLPVIVMPHGGPWLRDEWGYNSTVQFLCNRGYAVLQVNYRGSKGYGKEFILAGFKEWGGKIQDDIADGTKWLIEQGIADPDRIGIYGFSFGGYSALMGIIKYPELYRCAASYCGLVNLRTFVNSIPADWEPFKEMMYKMVGHPINDSIMLRNSSPYDLAERVKANVLIAQGAKDPKINITETEKLVEKLKKTENEVTYIVYSNEGHGFLNENNRIDFFKKLEVFFAKNLGGRKE